MERLRSIPAWRTANAKVAAFENPTRPGPSPLGRHDERWRIGVIKALEAKRADTVAVSPIVGGAALKGPAARMLEELGHECSAVGVARLYASFASTLVIDQVDADLAPAVETSGIRAVVADTIMSDSTRAAAVARATLAALHHPDRGQS